MAKYLVKFACGHEEEVQLYGRIRDRESRIAYWEEHGECSACCKAKLLKEREEYHAKAIDLASKYKYPTLEGSEKQIAWDIDIRQQWIDDLTSFLNERDKSWDYIINAWESFTDEKKEEILHNEIDIPICKVGHILTNTSAKFFIDKR